MDVLEWKRIAVLRIGKKLRVPFTATLEAHGQLIGEFTIGIPFSADLEAYSSLVGTFTDANGKACAARITADSSLTATGTRANARLFSVEIPATTALACNIYSCRYLLIAPTFDGDSAQAFVLTIADGVPMGALLEALSSTEAEIVLANADSAQAELDAISQLVASIGLYLERDWEYENSSFSTYSTFYDLFLRHK